MASLCREGGLSLHTSSLQCLKESLTLTVEHNVVLITVEDDDGRIVGVYIVVGTQTDVFVWLFGKLRIKQHVLW